MISWLHHANVKQTMMMWCSGNANTDDIMPLIPTWNEWHVNAAAMMMTLLTLQTPPTYKCPHSRPCYFLSTNWPTVIYGSKYFFPNIFIFLFFLYLSSSSMDASNARKASITSLNHGCSCGSSWNNV